MLRGGVFVVFTVVLEFASCILMLDGFFCSLFVSVNFFP